MEPLILFIVGFVLAIPVMSIVALVRAGQARRLVDAAGSEHRRELDALRAEVAYLRREFAQSLQSGILAGTPEAKQTTPAQAPAAAHFETAANQAPPLISPDRAPVKAPISVRLVSAPAPPIPPTQGFHHSPAPTMAVPEGKAAECPVAPSTPQMRASSSPPRPAPSESTRRDASTPSTAPAPFAPSFATAASAASLADRLRSALPLEELLGMNIFAKIGIVLLVLGFALLGRMALVSMGPAERVVLIYATSAALLGGGIWLETRERYRLIGRAGIGGGWALLFFTTYAMHYVAAMAVLSSNTADCILMLLIAISMVAHTLRYKSQAVTGLAFLLAFSTVALSQNTVYALSSGVILAIAIVAIALRMGWYELEVFGILASYANHLYWLFKLSPNGFAGHDFPQFWPSTFLLVLYWLIFRISYVLRRIRAPRDETVSALAALGNTLALLGLMKFQSTRPELAFYALLGLGVLEFSCGQLPLVRRRRRAFQLLTVAGTVLIFASVPFKFSGNSIALFWIIAAELLLIAGILQVEVVFRRLGLIAGSITGLLILFQARHLIALRQSSDTPFVQDGILLLSAGLIFAINAHFASRRWKLLFGAIDRPIATSQGYIGAVAACFGTWAILGGDWTVVGWIALFLLTSAGKRLLDDDHLLVQAWALAGSVLIRCIVINCHFDTPYPHHVGARLVTLPVVAGAFYLAAWLLSSFADARVHLRLIALWAASIALATLAWLEVSPPWIAPVWISLSVAMAILARRFQLAS